MSQHEIQLRPLASGSSLPQALPPELGGSLGGYGGGAGPALGGGAPQQTPLQKVHRLLRGRYGLAIVLAILFGVAGAAIGWLSQTPEYQSVGIVEIKPYSISVLRDDRTMPFYEKHLQSQPQLILSPRMLQRAVDMPQWQAAGLGNSPDAVAMLRGAAEAVYLKGTQYIRIACTHEHPAVAQAACQALIAAYDDLYREMNGTKIKDALQKLEGQRDKLKNSIRDANAQIFELAEKHGSEDLTIKYEKRQASLTDVENRLKDAKLALGNAEQMAGGDDALQRLRDTMTAEDIAVEDATMRQYLERRNELKIQLARDLRRLGANHRTVQDTQAEIELVSGLIDDYAERWRKTFVLPLDPSGKEAGPLTPVRLEQYKRIVNQLQRRFDEDSKELNLLGQGRNAISKLRNQIVQDEKELEAVEKRYEAMLVDSSGSGNLEVVNEGDAPVPVAEKRAQMAFVGFVGASALPIALMLLYGLLFETGYRYSEEASTDMSGVALLGILPELPDRLSDPDQAATAAHCVHQIRTMLQINRHDDEPVVYAVTSASPGDGKTSLSLALGLSFAASGSRTLLIDADLVGAGLTARLDMAGPEGILEAMSHKTLLEYVRQTDVADLSILPVGLAQAHHAALFSPSALRRLVSDAKKHFEIVIIDTGPILGSIEATPVAATADGVILTVARGQERPLVEKALQHLRTIGARFAGVVFNRARARDFERSISGMSLRSIARGHGHNGHGSAGGFNRAEGGSLALGPVARAVQGSVSGSGSESSDSDKHAG